MDLKRITTLIQVAEHGSFSKAASVLGIAQPALGRQVKKLEEECGGPLLYRHGRGVRLTPEGERLLERVRPLLRQMESAVLELREEQCSPSGVVTLGLTPTLCALLGVRLLTLLRQQHPGIRLQVITGYSGHVHEWLMSERVDLAVLHDARKSPQLLVAPLTALDLSLVSPASALTPAARRMAGIALKDLAGLPLVLPTRNHGLRRTVESAASQAGIELDVAFEVDSLELMKALVEDGQAHTVLAAAAVRQELRGRRLVARLLHTPTVTTRLLVAAAANRPQTRAVKIVETALRTVVAELAGDGGPGRTADQPTLDG